MSIPFLDSPDWQRITPLGNQLINSQGGQTVADGTSYTWGPFYVGTAPGLLLTFGCPLLGGAGSFSYSLEWAPDETFATADTYPILVQKNSGQLTNVVLPNYGPFFRISVFNNLGAPGVFYGAVRLAPPSIGQAPSIPVQVLASGLFALGNGGSIGQTMDKQTPGTATVFFQSFGAPTSCALQVWTVAGWTTLAYMETTSTEMSFIEEIQIPLDDIQLFFINSSGATQNFQYAVTVRP